MNKKITISGLAGSGKSTIGKLLAVKLNVPFLSMGNISRDLAREKYNLDINAFQRMCDSNLDIDLELDQKFQSLGASLDNFVMDYRLGALFVPSAFHIYLKVDEIEAASRIKFDDRLDEFKSDKLESKLFVLRKRNATMIERFKKIYGFDFKCENRYNLVINTTSLSTDDIVQEIITVCNF